MTHPTPRDSAQLPPLPEPDSFLFQHEETGVTQFVDSQQVEWGFEKNNPRLQKIGGAYTESQMQAYAREALRAQAASSPATPPAQEAAGTGADERETFLAAERALSLCLPCDCWSKTQTLIVNEALAKVRAALRAKGIE